MQCAEHPTAQLCVLQIGIILSSLGVLSLSAFNFLQIVELLNIIYCLAELMEFVAFIYLRYKSPDLIRWLTCSILAFCSIAQQSRAWFFSVAAVCSLLSWGL